jgi:hypothetical protein
MWVNAYERKFIWENKTKRNKYLELPTQHLTLVSGFNDSRRVKILLFLPVKLGNVSLHHVFLVSPQMLTSAILGIDFFINTSLIYSISMCRMRQFVAVLRRTFHSSLLYTFLATLLHQLFFHPPSLHLAIYFLVYLMVLLFPDSYRYCLRNSNFSHSVYTFILT